MLSSSARTDVVKAVIVGIALVACGSPSLARQEAKSAIFVLVDLSKSFAPLRREDLSALHVVAQTIADLPSSDVPRPISVLWLGIGNSSQHEPPPCGPAFEYDPILVKRPRRNKVGTKEDLALRLDECIRLIDKRSKIPDDWTDISGALEKTAETMEGFSRKVVFVLSDFVESRPANIPAPSFDLKDSTVVLLYRPEQADITRPDALIRRLAQWQQKLILAGARGPVCRKPVHGLSLSILATCLAGRN
jgi:hypothetical protein